MKPYLTYTSILKDRSISFSIIHCSNNLFWLPVALVGPSIFDVKDHEEKSPRTIYCSSCEIVTNLNPAKSVSGYWKHVRDEHGSQIDDLPDIDVFGKSYNISHMGSKSLSFIAGVKFIDGKVSHPKFFKDYHKKSTGVTPNNLAAFFVN